MRDLDPSPILDALGLLAPARSTPVAGGADMAIWRVEQETATYALRLFRPEHDAAFQRELAAMRAARDRGLPVPAVHGEAIWHDRPALLLDWMPGQPLRDALCAHPRRAWTLGVAFGRAQARIHQTPPPLLLRQDLFGWIAWATPDDDLRDQLAAVATGEPVLLHLDYHPMNVLVVEQQVSAILDWTNARAGDPRADLARTASILRFTPAATIGFPAPLAAIARRWFVAGWRRGYRELTGPLHGMAPFYAWAGAVMVRDLAPRVGRPDLPWLTEELLDRVQAWADGWRTRAKW